MMNMSERDSLIQKLKGQWEKKEGLDMGGFPLGYELAFPDFKVEVNLIRSYVKKKKYRINVHAEKPLSGIQLVIAKLVGTGKSKYDSAEEAIRSVDENIELVININPEELAIVLKV